MFRWIPYAFVRIVVFFCGGVLLAIYCPDFFYGQVAAILFCILCLAYLALALGYSRLKINPGLMGMLAIFVAGYINVQWKNESRRSDHLTKLKDSVQYYTAVITRPPEEKEKSWKYEAKILEVQTKHGWKKAHAKILLYHARQGADSEFNFGDNVLIKGAPAPIQGPSNPGEFDYQRFSAFKNIYHQHFVKGNQITYLNNRGENRLMNYAFRCRLWAETALKKNIQGEREQALASALVLGVTDGLDNELLNAYAASGAMHVLSVSGLHVGIVYWVILLLFRPFQKIQSSKWILAFISLAILWGYAFITGVSPSVLRAVTMFSFVAISRPLNRQTNIYNTLAASAFFLLLYDPFMIMSVGFQLSYLAVFGIVSLQQPLYLLLEPRNRFLDEVWKISAVSIAAQLATFSLGLFYFHQFPNYFLLTNLFVIPISFVVLLMGIVVISTSAVASVASFVGIILEWIIRVLNEGVFIVERLPFSLLENIYINSLQCWLLILLVVAIYVWTETKKVTAIVVISLLCIMFSAVQWFHLREDVQTQQLTVYKVPGHTAVDLIINGQSHFLSDSLLQADNLKTKYHLLPARIKSGVRTVLPGYSVRRETRGCALMVWNGISILHITQSQHLVPNDFNVDYLIISNNAVESLKGLLANVKAKKIILDSSNTFYKSNQLLKESMKMKVEIFSVLHRGAYTKTI